MLRRVVLPRFVRLMVLHGLMRQFDGRQLSSGQREGRCGRDDGKYQD